MVKHACITGGTKGIGYAVAGSLARMGYHLLLTYRSDTVTAAEAGRTLRETCGVEVTTLQLDMAGPDATGLLMQHLTDRQIRLDVVVFNAGLTCRDSFEEMTFPAWERVFFANVHFPTFLLQRLVFSDHLAPGGSVVFTGSLMGILPHATSLPYGVTKAAVHALVKNLVKVLAPHRIRVNAVAPGFVDTEWQKNKPADIRRNIEEKIALKRFCTPDELADVYRLLIENTYINGEIIVADGGYAFQ
jgi:3-oxoacyl-[acyl-carrier protein] reductase